MKKMMLFSIQNIHIPQVKKKRKRKKRNTPRERDLLKSLKIKANKDLSCLRLLKNQEADAEPSQSIEFQVIKVPLWFLLNLGQTVIVLQMMTVPQVVLTQAVVTVTALTQKLAILIVKLIQANKLQSLKV